jgi:hypothetical protein
MSSFSIRFEISADPRSNGQLYGGLRKQLAACAWALTLISALSACSKRRSAPEQQASTPAAPAAPPVASARPPEPEPEPNAKPEPPPPAAPEPPEPPTARSAAAATGVTVTDVFDDYGFPAYTGLAHLCGGRDLLGGGEQSSWDVFSSSDAPEQVVAAYTRRLGQSGLEREAGASTWRLPAGSPAPDRSLRVVAPDRPGRHTSCATKPGADVKSVVIVTRR